MKARRRKVARWHLRDIVTEAGGIEAATMAVVGVAAGNTFLRQGNDCHVENHSAAIMRDRNGGAGLSGMWSHRRVGR